MVTAFEFQNALAPGGCPRDSDRAHRRLGARVYEADALDRRHQALDAGSELDLEGTGGPVAGAPLDRLCEALDQAARCVPVNERSPGHHVIDERVAIDVLNVCTKGARNEQR